MESTRVDLAPQAAVVAGVVAQIGDDQLTWPTPCADTSVAGLLDHLVGLTVAFHRAAEKTPVQGAPSADASRLPEDWRELVPAQLDALVEAWQEPSAWEGTAEAGGVVMPAPVAAVVALDEVLVHGWDLAVATGQEYWADPASVAACTGFVAPVAAGEPRPGLFGPPVPVPDDAPAFDRLLGLTGRDPGWRPPTRAPFRHG
ncbi:TIGR03086 family protein [Geodermatophilus sp. TF02-6]|uniref:TIGR03086 family metal-binding protein n=1 Tax=Geodermatophilus sp. TF02-6 TaxID=2250575 RepID=UPI000DEBFA18|nr:TIGR03086 family metal-binding protein [Geodermatophilus sp. TF02-6]RBY80550.1 TIGR03086 family protein [Geodermatophilus sp. TF02-6]